VQETTEAVWKKTLQELERSHRDLKKAVENLAEDQLNEKIKGGKISFYVLLHGVVQHDLYHAGQIALLKKL